MSPDSEGWKRLHPVTIVRELVGVAWNLVLAAFVFGAFRDGPIAGLEIILPVAFLGVAVARYLSTRYLVTADAVLWRRGVLFRRRVEVPRGRIQNVASGADVIGRVFGLRTVTISTAGSEGEIELALVTDEEASFLVGELLGRRDPAPDPAASMLPPAPGPLAAAEGVAERHPAASTAPTAPPPPSHPTASPGPAPPAPAAVPPPPAARRLVSVSAHQLVVYALTGSAVGALVALVVFGSVSVVMGSLGPLSLVLFGVLAPVMGVVDLVDFQLSAESDRIRVRHGLLQTRDKWARRERIQLLGVERRLLRAALGYETISVATADATVGTDSTLSLCHPLAPRASWPALAAEVLEPTELTEAGLRPISPRARFRRTVRLSSGLAVAALPVVVAVGLLLGPAAGLAAAAVAAVAALVAGRLLAARAQRLDGFDLDGQHLLVRRGLVGSRLWLVRRAKVQSASLSASPFQRRLGLASVLVDTASVTGGAIVVPDLARADAEELARTLVELADRVFLPDGV